MRGRKITKDQMLETIAVMAMRLDLTSHDIIEAFRELGYGSVIVKARKVVEEADRIVKRARKR